MFKKILASAILSVTLLAFGASSGVAANDLGSWQKALIKKVMKKQTYPRSAISREIEGKAKVRIVVNASGEIMSHEVVEPTGEDVLDREIPKLVQKLNPLPALPDGRDELAIVLPLNWSLD